MGAISPNAGIESWVLFPQNTRIGRYLHRVPLWDCSTPILPESPNKFGVFAWVQKVSKAHLPRRCWLPNFLWQIHAKSVTLGFDFETGGTDPDSNPSHKFWLQNLCDGSWLKSVTPSFDFRTCVTDPDSNPSHPVLLPQLVWRILTQIRHTSLFVINFRVTNPDVETRCHLWRIRGRISHKSWLIN